MHQRHYHGQFNLRLFGSLATVTLAMVLLAACGGGSKTSTSASNSHTSSGTTSNASTNSQTSLKTACDPMAMVTINEHTASGKADQYFFAPDHITIKAGEFITFSNQSDEVHVLVSTPAAALSQSAIDRNEQQPVQFTRAGTYTLESQDVKHRATMQVTVTSATGSTCGISTPSTTISFMEKHTQGQPDLYALTPKTVSIHAGQSIILSNLTDQALNFSCKPSADIMEGNLRVDMNEQQVVQFAKVGNFTCTSTASPTSTLVVDVH